MMIKFLRYLVVAILSFSSIAYAEIYDIKTIEAVTESTNKADQSTLVIFDVDSVIIRSREPADQPNNSPLIHKIIEEYRQKYGDQYADRIALFYAQQLENFLIEPKVKEIIDNIKVHNIPVIALTAIPAILHKRDLIDWRFKDLQRLGITFQFKNIKKIVWNRTSGYEKGIIVSGSQPKGDALLYFLQYVAHWMPKTIIFIDDRRYNLENVGAMCKQNNIKFIGYHYLSHCFDHQALPDEKIIRSQFEILDRTGKWVKYDELVKKQKVA